METKFNEVANATESGKLGKHHKFMVAILVILIAGIVCWHIHRPKLARLPGSIDPKPGTICIVQFRQDALGPMQGFTPATQIINGAVVLAKVELIAISHEAILFDQVNASYIVNGIPKMKRFWIPKSSILSIEFEPTRTFLDLPQDNVLRIEYEAMQRVKEMKDQ